MKKIFLLLLSLGIVACSATQSADSIIFNAALYTVDPALPDASVMVIRDGRIESVGGEELLRSYHSEEMIDMGGKFVLPGFNDSHVHLMEGANNLLSVQLRDANTPDIFIQRIAEFAKSIPAGTWITGGDWDHTLWGGELPRSEWIDSVTSGHPVYLNRLDGHMVLVNSVAMELAGVGNEVQNVAGGEIVRENGKLTGIFKDNAMELFFGAIPHKDFTQELLLLQAAQEYLHGNGVTSVTDMGSWNNQEFYERARELDSLKLRIYSCVPLSMYETLARKVSEQGRGDEWVKIGGLKGFVDGSLGSHTAAFLKPYDDQPSDSGFFVISQGILEEQVRGAVEKDLQVCIHAIGDRAIRELLDIYTGVSSENPEKDLRFRIEHAQHIDPEDIGRFVELGVTASMQPYHAIDDGRWADQLIGPGRAGTTYAFRGLLDAGASLAFGSDWFVAPATPMEGIYAAVTRQTLDGANPEGWVPEQKIRVEEAIRAYTMGSAYATFSENIKGSLSPGKLADFVVLDRDPFEVDPVELRNILVLETYIGGEKVWQRK